MCCFARLRGREWEERTMQEKPTNVGLLCPSCSLDRGAVSSSQLALGIGEEEATSKAGTGSKKGRRKGRGRWLEGGEDKPCALREGAIGAASLEYFTSNVLAYPRGVERRGVSRM